MMAAGTSQFTSDGRKRAKNPEKGMSPFCHTISVVMSPKGENAPPALAATTMLISDTSTKRGLPTPTLSTTVPISSAVVRLSAIGEMQNANAPVIQNRLRKLKPRDTNHPRSASNTPRSSIELMYVIAASKNKKSSAYSSRLCRTIASANCVSASFAAGAVAALAACAYRHPISAQMMPAATSTGFDLRRCRYSSPITTA